jgi:hypothetical protein
VKFYTNSDLYLATEICYHPEEGFSFLSLLSVGKSKQQFSHALKFITHKLPYHLALETFAIKDIGNVRRPKIVACSHNHFPVEMKQYFLGVFLDMLLSTIQK